MSKTDLVVCYATLDGHFRRLGQQSRPWSDKQAEISCVEQNPERILKTKKRPAQPMPVACKPAPRRIPTRR